MTPVDTPPRVALTSLGCKVNFAEMAELAGVLAAAGCDIVAEDEPAHVRVLNSCTVTTQADATTRQRLRRLRRADPEAHLVLTGCSVDANPQLAGDQRPLSWAALGVDAVFANATKPAIAAHVLQVTAQRGAGTQGAAPRLRARAFIKVQDGCDHRCTYCIVWKARGASRSLAADMVLRRVDEALDASYAELVLCGVDLGSYGHESGGSLAGLLATLLDRVGARPRIRLSSINANDVDARLIELNAHPRLCAHWHMPLQSGSDTVLRAMHRGYRRRQYLRVAGALRDADPLSEFTTDVMVAFPGETNTDHLQTLALIDEVGFLGCHVFRWSPRPGTPASQLADRVSDPVARRRSAEVRRAAAGSRGRSLSGAARRVHEVVWDQVDPGEAHGLSATYHEVVTAEVAGLREGDLSLVQPTGVDGERLRATLLHP